MAKDDDTEESLEEAAGYSLQSDKNDLKDSDKTFLKCSNKIEIIDDEKTKEEENNHKLVKRIINDEYSSQASAIIDKNSDNSDNSVCSKLIGFEDSDGRWKICWEIEKPESEDFIALCLLGKWGKL